MVAEPIKDIEGLVYVADWDAELSAPDHITIHALIARAVAPEMRQDERKRPVSTPIS